MVKAKKRNVMVRCDVGLVGIIVAMMLPASVVGE
jgi:hypothetical protein